MYILVCIVYRERKRMMKLIFNILSFHGCELIMWFNKNIFEWATYNMDMVGMLPTLIEPGRWADELNGSGSKHLEAENGFQGKRRSRTWKHSFFLGGFLSRGIRRFIRWTPGETDGFEVPDCFLFFVWGGGKIRLMFIDWFLSSAASVEPPRNILDSSSQTA